MEILTKSELVLKAGEIIKKIKAGAVFIHPTDTIYGLGCNALDEKAVKKIRELKQRPNTPFSVIAPSLDWITQNCQITKKDQKWLEKLPGPYTLIVKLKNKSAVAKNVTPGQTTIGVRLPDHWFSGLVQEMNVPFITTSVNKSGQSFMTTKEDLDEGIKRGVDFLIYEGEKRGRPSKIVNLVQEEVIER